MNSLTMRRWLPFFLVMSVLAGCRSEQVAFDFGPLPGAARPLSVLMVPAVATQPADSLAQSFASKAIATSFPGQPAHQKAVLAAGGPAHLAQASTKPPKRLMQQLVAARRPHQQPAAAQPTDQGLGKIFFFLLAIVLAVLAGLAFAVAAIFSIGFWAALGYVVAGIVVLLLLRSLVRKLTGKK